MNVEPFPNWLSTSIVPFMRSMTCFTMEGPGLTEGAPASAPAAWPAASFLIEEDA
jgi:hypothetical protein